MTKHLTIDEMLDVAHEIAHPLAVHWEMAIEAIGSAMAHELARKLGVKAGEADYQGSDFGGTCATFRPAWRAQKCPKALEHHDPGEWEDGYIEPTCQQCGEADPDKIRAGYQLNNDVIEEHCRCRSCGAEWVNR